MGARREATARPARLGHPASPGQPYRPGMLRTPFLHPAVLREVLLEVDGGADRLARRGEDAERLAPSKLQELSSARSRDLSEHCCELAGDLVASLLREQGVATHVGDEERPDVTPSMLSVWPGSGRSSRTMEDYALR